MKSQTIFRTLLMIAMLGLVIALAPLPSPAQGQGTNILSYGSFATGSITAQAPMGIYLFSGAVGDLVTISAISTSGTLSPAINLVGPSQEAVGRSDTYSFALSNPGAFVSVFLPTAGMYSLLVWGIDNTAGDYLLNLQGRVPVVSTPLVFGKPVDVEIPQFPTSPQYFSFEADPTCVTSLTVTDLVEGDPMTFPFAILVRDQTGTRIAMVQGGRLLEDVVSVMPNSGQYEVEIRSADPETSGAIRLEVGCADDAPLCRTPSGQRLFPLSSRRLRTPRTPPGGSDQPGSPGCGNGIVEAPEQCDPPDGVDCNNQCQKMPTGNPFCGDGVITPPGEQCDPPNGTTCAANCQLTTQQPECGNGVVETGEQCDPPNTVDCTAQCQKYVPNCGNGVVEAGEQCDPPNTVDCTAQCQKYVPNCGNGIIDAGEQCDPPNATDCTAQCLTYTPYCGNGIIDAGEQCDPPNTTDCTAQCQKYVPYCGNGIIDAGEQCDPPNTTDCTAQCLTYTPYCGNGIIDAGEACDPPGAGCTKNCQLGYCGDGEIDPSLAEQCDPPNTTDCTAQCQIYTPACGNGIVDAGEQCDPPGPGCNKSCLFGYCGDGEIDPSLGEQCEPPDGLYCTIDTCLIIPPTPVR